ncbi:DUF2796 domain-containing protein [Nitrosomonas sp. Nm132]|uniref:DUF2796 domain-containing protein n=1 Tax=Nitrosomonas sp. Nm132 TaxID=1881053 RepID=UPI0008806ADB|nr:DUF2796 domain-containing protein [Nitrosomonas sp. Nm132]SDH04037.1 Protein of unknown function [Nitrosomonas sp. Nm132]
MVNRHLLIGWLWILLGSSPQVFSSGAHLTQGAHVHGEAMLNIVLEGNALSIEFDSPAVNLIGFEHAPSNEEQAAAFSNAKQMLASADRLFDFSATTCLLEHAEIEMPYMKNHESADHQHHHEAQQEHADFHASYTFHCEQAKDLTAISIKLFALFPGIQAIKAQWIFQGKQGSASLTVNNATLGVD